jgi:hypothetical protein
MNNEGSEEIYSVEINERELFNPNFEPYPSNSCSKEGNICPIDVEIP